VYSGSYGGQDSCAKDLWTGIGGVRWLSLGSWCDPTIGGVIAEYNQVIRIIDVYLSG